MTIEFDIVEDMIQAGRIIPSQWKTVSGIIQEEMRACFYQDKPLESILPILKNRVTLYLQENDTLK